MEKPSHSHSTVQKFRSVTPDWLSYLASIISLGVAFSYYYAIHDSLFFLWATFLIFVRIILNKIDDEIVFEKNVSSVRSRIINILPDRYSDMLMLIGIGVSTLCRPIFSLLGIASVALISYTGLLGKAVGFDWQNQGPLRKLPRLVLLIVFTLIQYAMNIRGIQYLFLGMTSLEVCMVFFIILGQLTVFNRLRGIKKENTKTQWLTGEKYRGITKKILIAYDSETGNTERVAEEISNGLKVGIRKIDDITSVDAYDLVIFGCRELGNRPSKKMIEFIKNHQEIKEYAVFITYKNYFWGAFNTRMCFSYFKRLLGKNPIGVFACKAAYGQEELYLEHLQEDPNLLNAFLFGIKLVQNLEKES
jgi:flavodoxin/phosphatidylglycerophosphate synthase